MSQNAKGSGLLMLAAMLLPMTVAAADVAEHPEWKVGDKWIFRSVENPGDKQDTWRREVVAVLPEDKVDVVMGSGKHLTFDNEANSLDARGPEYSWRRFKFPMSVGAKWDHDYKTAAGGLAKSSWQVRAYEKLTVPAGTFDCFKVEGEVFRDNSGIATGSKNYWKGYTKTTYWYCPAIKWAAKWETEDIAYVSAPRVVTVSELVSFEQTP